MRMPLARSVSARRPEASPAIPERVRTARATPVWGWYHSWRWTSVSQPGGCRVARDVAAPGPHGSGRADFPHPALRVTDSLLSRGNRCAIRGSLVETLADSRFRARLSLPRLRAPASPSLRGVPAVRFPRFVGTTRGSDFLPSIPPRSFPSLGGYQRRSVVRSRGGRAAPSASLGVYGLPFRHRWRWQDLPGSWRSPDAFAALSDPGGTSAPRDAGAPVLPAFQLTTLAPTNGFVSRLHHAAPALPVYASQPGSPPHHATLGSRPVASLCRAGFVLLGPTEGFAQLHGFLPLQAWPGAPTG